METRVRVELASCTRRGRAPLLGPHVDHLAWSKDLAWGGAGSPAVAADGTIYVPSSNPTQLWAVAPNGDVKWQLPVGGVASSVAIGSDGTLYFGANDQKLYAVSPSGTLKWTFKADKSAITGDSFVTAPAIGADGTLYVGASDTKLYAVNANGTLK